MTTFVMQAKENYDPASAAELVGDTQSPAFSLDPTNLACSYDFENRLLTYLGLMIPGAVYPAKTWTNDTGHTLYAGSTTIYAPSATVPAVDATQSAFSPYIMQKSLDTGVVAAYPTYSESALVPANVGCTYAFVSNRGSGYTTASVTVSGGGGGAGMQAVAQLDAGGSGLVVNVEITNWGNGYTTVPTFTVVGDGTGATIGTHAYNTPSDGTYRWVGADFSPFVTSANGPGLVNPRNGDYWICAQSCELYQYRKADDFAQILAPMKYADDSSPASNPISVPVGIDATWCYATTNRWEDGRVEFVLVPAAIQAAETTAASKLPYVIWRSSPFSGDNGLRLTFGTDGDVYIVTLGNNGSGKFYWRLTQYAPPALGSFGSNAPGTMTDLTSSLWNTGGPNTDGANYTLSTFNSFPASLLFALCRLPATNQLAAVLKMPKEASSDPADYTKTLFSCLYVTLGGSPAYDYHSGFVTGYMDGSWVSSPTIPATGWAVVDCREHDNYLEQSDHLYSGVDYAKRWFAFKCYPISGGVVDTSHGLMDVLVQYLFVSGSPPAVVSPPGLYTDTDWDANYPDYQTAISQQYVVYNSTLLGTVAQLTDQFEFNSALVYPDPGIYDATTNSFWYSGMTNPDDSGSPDGDAVFYLDSAFTYRAAYNSGPNGNYGAINPPFLRLSFGVTPPPAATYRANVWSTIGFPQL